MPEKSHKRVTSNLCQKQKVCFKTFYNKEANHLMLKNPGTTNNRPVQTVGAWGVRQSSPQRPSPRQAAEDFSMSNETKIKGIGATLPPCRSDGVDRWGCSNRSLLPGKINFEVI